MSAPIRAFRTRPTVLVALWAVLGIALGAVAAQPGRRPAVHPLEREGGAHETEPRAAAMNPSTARGLARPFAGVHPYIVAREQALAMADPVAPGANRREWVALGPSDVGGRVRALVIDPRDPNVLFAGGVAGGVWKSLDAGETWAPLTETFANVAVSSIAMDPADPDVLYVGTGEYSANRPSVEPVDGIGIMKSTDGGATWRLLPGTIGNPDFRVVNDVVVSTASPDTIYAGVTAGVARSTDGGRSWTVVHRAQSPLPDPQGCGDIAVRTDRTPDVILAACSDELPVGVFRSEDGGDRWAEVVGQVAGEPGGYTAIAFAPSNQDIAYASVARTADSVGGQTGTLGLLRSQDGGKTWEVRNSGGWTEGSPSWLNPCNEQWGQGSYGNAIAVDPVNPDRLWLGGIDAFRSDDGGRTITIASYWWLDQRYWPNLPSPSPWMHADFHAIVFGPRYDGSSNQTVYFANDGGVFRTRNALAPLPSGICDDVALSNQPIGALNKVTYESLNDGLTITQFWGGAVSADGTMVMGGTQDNGTWLRPAGAAPDGWRFVIGGDGFDTAIAPTNDLFYGEVYGHAGIRILRASTPSLSTFREITAGSGSGPPPLNDSGLFFTPFTLDPQRPQTVWTGGHYMWRSTDAGDVWVAVSPQLVSAGYDGISAIGVSPSDSDVVYAGSSTGELFVTRNGTQSPPTWSRSAAQGYITAIAVDPTNPAVAYAAVGWFDVPRVLKTTDHGATWRDVGVDLPNVPANAVAVNPLDPSMVFVGTDSGVFESQNGGRTWFPANGSLVSTIVQELVFRPGTSDLYLFTHGRGAYRVDVGTGG